MAQTRGGCGSGSVAMPVAKGKPAAKCAAKAAGKPKATDAQASAGEPLSRDILWNRLMEASYASTALVL